MQTENRKIKAATNSLSSFQSSLTVESIESSLSTIDELRVELPIEAAISMFSENIGSNIPGKNSPRASIFRPNPMCFFIT